MPNKDEAGMVDMSRDDFISIMKESGVLIKKEEEKKSDARPPKGGQPEEEENKAPAVKYDEQDVYEATSHIHAFEEDQLGYVEFLESLTRVTMTYPFTDEQEEQLPMFEMKWGFIMGKLEDKFKGLKKVFLER